MHFVRTLICHPAIYITLLAPETIEEASVTRQTWIAADWLQDEE